jgi:hypothetical protein
MASTPTTQQSIDKIAAYIADALPKAGDFALEQAPDVLQQIIALDFWRAVYGGVVLGACSVVLWIIVWRSVRCLADNDMDTRGFVGTVFGGIAAVLCTIGFCVVTEGAIAPIFAPKAHLLERIGVLK